MEVPAVITATVIQHLQLKEDIYMFGIFGKKQKCTESAIMSFLREADKAYVKALETKNVQMFEQYCTLPMSRNIEEIIGKGNLPYFGLERYRKVTWENLPEELHYKKNLTHEDVKVTAKVRLALGDDMVELWTVVCQDDKYKVSDIVRVK